MFDVHVTVIQRTRPQRVLHLNRAISIVCCISHVPQSAGAARVPDRGAVHMVGGPGMVAEPRGAGQGGSAGCRRQSLAGLPPRQDALGTSGLRLCSQLGSRHILELGLRQGGTDVV